MEAAGARIQRFRFYSTATGKHVVKEEMRALGPEGAAALAEAMKRRKHHEEFARDDEQIKGRLRAIRATANGQEYRALYAPVGNGRVLLAVKVVGKKSRRLPKQVIRSAERRLGDWESRGNV